MGVEWELLASAQPLGRPATRDSTHLGLLLKCVEGVCRDPELSRTATSRKSRLWSQGAVAHWGGARGGRLATGPLTALWTGLRPTVTPTTARGGMPSGGDGPQCVQLCTSGELCAHFKASLHK